MWPFKKRNKEKRKDWRTAGAEKCREAIAIGQEFKFMGIKMTCVGYNQIMTSVPGDGMHWRPSVNAKYVDRNGVIREYLISPAELVLIK